MADLILTSERIQTDPEGRQFLKFIKDNEESLSLRNAVLYYDFPSYTDYDSVLHKPDFFIISPIKGLFAVKFISGPLFNDNKNTIEEMDISISEFTSIVVGRLLKSRMLRSGRTSLKFEIIPIVFAAGLEIAAEGNIESELVTSYEAFSQLISAADEVNLSNEEFAEVRSVVEGAKALSRPQKRIIQDPEKESKAAALVKLESEIANFDEKQRQTALSTVQGPQRIRGLAGSGKTIILAMKAAHLHMTYPTSKILVTFYTKSLKTTLEYLITRFYRHYKDEDPDWTYLEVKHGWGGSNVPGAYSDTCKRHNIPPMRLSDARQKSGNPFNYACRTLYKNVNVQPYYDYILIDEGQDFPRGFYELMFFLAKGVRDKKNIIWAYDELQNILNVTIPSSEDLFGLDDDGKPRISLTRSSEALSIGVPNDIVLNKCYRNQREVLLMAHALGFGLYGNIVQLLQDKEHWKDVGYEVVSGELVIGNSVEILRPQENSPLDLQEDEPDEIIDYYKATDIKDEVEWIAKEIVTFLDEGLQPEDILVIALDDRHAKGYFKRLSEQLSLSGIATNNIIADPFNEPPFKIEGRVSLSTVYRAKGNEATLVFTAGIDALSGKFRGSRNKLFTAFTRSKAWLRVTGIGENAQLFFNEIALAKENFPYLRFTMPDPEQVETIQRDLSEKAIEAKKIQEEYYKKLRKLGMSEDEILDMLRYEEK